MKKFSLILFAVLFSAVSVYSQKVKYGHVNGDEVYAKMAEVKKANEDLKTFATTYETEIKRMQDEYKTKVEEYKKAEAGMADAIKKNKVDEINGINERLQKFQVSAQEDVIKKRNELFKPITEKFNTALKTVAKKGGYTLIIDTRNLLYYEDSADVTKQLEKELGIK